MLAEIPRPIDPEGKTLQLFNNLVRKYSREFPADILQYNSQIAVAFNKIELLCEEALRQFVCPSGVEVDLSIRGFYESEDEAKKFTGDLALVEQSAKLTGKRGTAQVYKGLEYFLGFPFKATSLDGERYESNGLVIPVINVDVP